jgi:hypothetical protein
MNCSFHRLVGGNCGPDKRSRLAVENVSVVPLVSCTKDITGHRKAIGVNDVDSEVSLILAHASIFNSPPDILDMTICPSHRSSLGIGWRRGSQCCRVPPTLSSHAKSGTSVRKAANQGINKAMSRTILRRTGIFLPVGSGAFCIVYIIIYYIRTKWEHRFLH